MPAALAASTHARTLRAIPAPAMRQSIRPPSVAGIDRWHVVLPLGYYFHGVNGLHGASKPSVRDAASLPGSRDTDDLTGAWGHPVARSPSGSGGRTAVVGAGNDRFERNRTPVRREAGSRIPSGSGNRAPGRQLRNDPSCRSTTLRNALNSASPGSPEP